MRITILVLFLSFGAHLSSQEAGGCNCHFADNYDPSVTFNNGTCDYDLQNLLMLGYGLGDLLGCGAQVQELIGLFGAGGFIVDIDISSGEVLVAWPLSSSDMNSWDHYNDVFTEGLKTYEVMETSFGLGIKDGLDNYSKLREAYGRRYPNAGDRGTFCGMYWNCNSLGVGNWFVPTESALLAYKNVCQAKYAGDAYNFNWDTDINTGTSTILLRSCGNNYPFTSGGTRWLWTSEPSNLGDGWVDELVKFKTINLGASASIGHDVQYSFGSSGQNVFPMGIGQIKTRGDFQICDDWSYGGSPNFASELNLPCTYPLFNCSTTNDEKWDQMARGIYPGSTTIADMDADSIRPLLLNTPGEINLDGVDYSVNYFQIDSIVGLPPGLTLSYSAGDTVSSDATVCMEWIGNPAIDGKYTITLFGTYFVETLGILYAFPEFQPFTHEIVLTEFVYFNTSNETGCTYSQAVNFNATASVDDGSCDFTTNCQGDFNGDELIGVQDILYLLGLYNTACE